MQRLLLCCNCVHVGVELETCAEALLSAADVTATPTATNAKMVSLNAIQARIPNSRQRRQQQRLQATEFPSQLQCRSHGACGLPLQSILALQSSEQRGCSATVIASACPTQSAMRQCACKLTMRGCTGTGLVVSGRPVLTLR